MKKVFLLALLILFGCGKKNNFTWSEYSLEEALALNTDKIIFLDFYSDTWGPCKRLEAETLNSKEVIEFANNNFISIKINVDNPEGSKIFGEYAGTGIPYLVFINGEGQEIESAVGFRNVDNFLLLANNVVSNTDTFMSLFEEYKQGNRNSDLIDKLSYKSETKNNDSLSIELYSIILNNKEEYLYMHNTLQRAEFYFAKLALKEGDISKMSNFINKGLTINSGLLEGHDWPSDWDMIR